tara:strand:+ start:3312 stop:3653 length:342 start_codon:yes stop_codon:yes gene_type:complete
MHELSIVMGIIDIAEKETKKVNKKNVEQIDLEIGSMSGVELVSLEYVWSTAVKNTVLEKAKLNIDYKEAKAKCLECHTMFSMEKMYDSCPKCKSHFKDILQGKELRVKSLEVV